MLIGVALLLALATVPLRGGSLAGLADVRFCATWIAFLAIGMQIVIISVVPGGSADLHRGVHVATYRLIGIFVVANRHIPYLWLISLGGAANFAAILANGGVMPARAGALKAAGIEQAPGCGSRPDRVPRQPSSPRRGGPSPASISPAPS